MVAYAGAGKLNTLIRLAISCVVAEFAWHLTKRLLQKRSKFHYVDRRNFSLIGILSYRQRYQCVATTAFFSQRRLALQIWGLTPVQVKRQIEGKSQFVTLTPERQARFCLRCGEHVL
ncbi:MAG: hypothetical protein U1E98_01500 [Moraxella osloensis]